MMKASEIKWSLLVWPDNGNRIRKDNLTHDELDAEVAELRNKYDLEMTCVRNFECVYVAEKRRTIADLNKGDWFTLKKIAEPKESQVWIRDEYDRSTKKYLATKWADIGASRQFKPETPVYTNFTF